MSKWFGLFQHNTVEGLKNDNKKLEEKREKINAEIDAEIEANNERIAKIESESKGIN